VSLTLASHTALLDHAGCVLWSRAHPGAPWQRDARQDAPVAALKTLLAGKKGRLSLHLAGTLAQPLLLPWVDGLDSREAWHGYAAHALAQRFGRAPSDWRLSWRLPTYRQSALVAGMSPTLWTELQALPLTLGPVRPLLCTVLGHWARRLGRDDTLLLLERRSVQWARKHNRRWQELGVVARNPQQTLPQLLANLRALGIVRSEQPRLLVADPGLLTLPQAYLHWALPIFAQGH